MKLPIKCELNEKIYKKITHSHPFTQETNEGRVYVCKHTYMHIHTYMHTQKVEGVRGED